MRSFLFAIASIFALVSSASATQISAFSQNSGSNTVFATANAGDTATSLSISNAQVTISQLFNNATPITADFGLTASSIDSATLVAGLAVQHYNGTFCLTSGPGCSGINFLSGVFTDAAVGRAGGPGLVVNVNNPPDSLSLTSSVIPISDLFPPNTFNLGFSNLSPLLSICGNTLCSFAASFVGDVSASAVYEPASLAILGIGLVGVGLARVRGRYGLAAT